MVLGIRRSLREIVRSLGFTNYQQHYYGLSISQAHTIVELDFHTQMTAQELATILLLNKSTVSRMLNKMEKLGIIVLTPNSQDSRSKLIALSPDGQALADKINLVVNDQIKKSLTMLTEEEQQIAKKGAALIALALRKTADEHVVGEFKIRPLCPSDNAMLKDVIKEVLKPYAPPSGEGTALNDESLNDMAASYKEHRSQYYVVEKDGIVYGGGGFAQLVGAETYVCELQKLYLSPSVQGKGLGKALMKILEIEAVKLGYSKCYLETLQEMHDAHRLYERMGFTICEKMGDTGHDACTVYYAKEF